MHKTLSESFPFPISENKEKMREKYARNKKRIQLVLGAKAVERLDKLKERMDPPNQTEVFRNSLQLLEAVIDEIDKGNEFLLKDKDGNIHPYRMFID